MAKTVQPLVRKLTKSPFKSGESDALRRNIDFGDFDAMETDETPDEFLKKWDSAHNAIQQPHFTYQKGSKSPLKLADSILEDYDPSYEDYDKALDYYLNTVDPTMLKEGEKIVPGIIKDLEENYGGNILKNLFLVVIRLVHNLAITFKIRLANLLIINTNTFQSIFRRQLWHTRIQIT